MTGCRSPPELVGAMAKRGQPVGSEVTDRWREAIEHWSCWVDAVTRGPELKWLGGEVASYGQLFFRIEDWDQAGSSRICWSTIWFREIKVKFHFQIRHWTETFLNLDFHFILNHLAQDMKTTVFEYQKDFFQLETAGFLDVSLMLLEVPGLCLLFTSRRSPTISGPILSCWLQRRGADVPLIVSWHHAAVLHVARRLWSPIPAHGAENDELMPKSWKKLEKGADSQGFHGKDRKSRGFGTHVFFLGGLVMNWF